MPDEIHNATVTHVATPWGWSTFMRYEDADGTPRAARWPGLFDAGYMCSLVTYLRRKAAEQVPA